MDGIARNNRQVKISVRLMVTIKNKAQIQSMKKAGAIVRDTLKLLEERIKPGMTTKELDQIAYEYITKCGAYPSFKGFNGYPASICASIDEEVVHGIPSPNRVIEEGQIVSIDVGAYIEGYHGDAARTFAIGKVSELKQRLIEATRQSFFEGINVIMHGQRLGTVSYTIQKYVEDAGFSVVRALVGHGIGTKMHEEPSVPNYGKEGTGLILKEGMTLAVEPMVNAGSFEVEFCADGWTVKTKDRSPSAHYENTILVCADGVEILTL